MSQSVEQFDIVVVGAGLVGATLAALLGQTTTLNIALVDGGPEPAQPLSERFDPRVVALTRHSQNLFERLGIWAAMAKGANRQHLACPYTHMHVWDGEGTATIDFDGRDLHQENLGFIVENSLLINHLVKAIGVLPRVELCWTDGVSSLETTAFNDLPTTTLQLQSGRRLRAPLVLAADGANSKIRQLAQFDTREWAYGQKAIVTTVKTEQAHQYTALQRFMSTGPLAFLPCQAFVQ